MRIVDRGAAAEWTKERINRLTTPDVLQLRANAERLHETGITALCDEVLGERPRGRVAPRGKTKRKTERSA